MSTQISPTVAPQGEGMRTAYLALAVVFMVVAGTIMAFGGFNAASMGLVVAFASLMLCLVFMFQMALVLTRPTAVVELEREGDVVVAGRRELREERRRVLRAINELKFDHQMGKLSEADYREVRKGYELRAIDVIRALEAEPELDPRLREDLRALGVEPEEGQAQSGPQQTTDAQIPEADSGSEAATDPSMDESQKAESPAAQQDSDSEIETSSLICPTCGATNDADAKFCKECGKALVA